MVRIAFRTNCHAASLERNYDIFVRSHLSCLPPPPILTWFFRAMLDHVKAVQLVTHKALFGFFFLPLITSCLISVTHHLSFKILHLVWHHYSLIITQYFHIVCGPHSCHSLRASLFCYLWKVFIPIFFPFLISPSPFSPITLPKHKPKPIKISQALRRWSGNAISSVKAQRRRRSVKKHKPSNSHLLL